MLPPQTTTFTQNVWLGRARPFYLVNAFARVLSASGSVLLILVRLESLTYIRGRVPAAYRSVLFITLGMLWVLSIAIGLTWLAQHQMTPGEMAAASAQWPEETSIARNADGYTLLLFAHPRCSCTRASLQEFKKIVASYDSILAPYVVFLKPEASDENWLATDQVVTAKSLTGVQVLTDTAGQEAKRFGAVTSGHVVLYGPAGTLIFNGGITLGRGHVGENAGRQTVEQILANQVTEVNNSSEIGCPVFGCPLFENENLD